MDKQNNALQNHDFSSQERKQISELFSQREEGRTHFSYNEEMLQYEYLRDGDMKSVAASRAMFQGQQNGVLSGDPVMNKKYLFVANTTLATRFAIEGGMSSSRAYNISDSYIQQLDRCHTVNDIYELQSTMFTDFTMKMAFIRKDLLQKQKEFSEISEPSRPVSQCMDYIYEHLHEKITLRELADLVRLSPSYLSALFHREKGMTIQQYIRKQKISSARNMLLYSDYSLTDIANFLAFSSASHFIKTFREETGMTPKEYLRKNYARHDRWAKENA